MSTTSVHKTIGNDTCEVDVVSAALDNPSPPVFEAAVHTARPITADTISQDEVNYTQKSLAEILREAMQNSPVLRDLGGVILRTPEVMKTGYTTRMQEVDPRYGMHAALSAFDAQMAASANFSKNDRLVNNAFYAGGTNEYRQQFNDYQLELSKKTATGSLLAIRGVSNDDWNNAPANIFSSAWNSWVEGEVRQPLLQGGGLEFNRIAGPGATPGVYNGILIAKANADINQHDFALALTDFVSNVENAYWDLYLAYREVDARKKAMEQAKEVYKKVEAIKNSVELPLARQQYYQLKAEVDEAISGRLLTGTQGRNGATGGTLQPGTGVLAAERRLRLLCGLVASDGNLIRPSEDPPTALITFDWETSLEEAMSQRVEIQKQNVTLKKRELELLAARNFLNPRLDAVGRYRVRGFGNDLIAAGSVQGITSQSALGNLTTLNHQEWMMGVELTVPLGYRKAHAAVDFAELAVARERVVLKEQEREIVSHLGGAFADIVRAYQAVQNNLEQYLAADDYCKNVTQEDLPREVSAERVLDAHRRRVNAEIQFFRARAEYAIALKNFHYEKGSLLTYKDLLLESEFVAQHVATDAANVFDNNMSVVPNEDDTSLAGDEAEEHVEVPGDGLLNDQQIDGEHALTPLNDMPESESPDSESDASSAESAQPADDSPRLEILPVSAKRFGWRQPDGKNESAGRASL